MRILSLTNFYPPVAQGGFEQWCQEVSEGLRARGHEVEVLTSRHRRAAAPGDPPWVRRDLYLEMELASLRNGVRFFVGRRRRRQANLVCLRRLVARFRPDAILAWGMWNLDRSLPALAEQLLPDRTVYYMGDDWPTLPAQYRFYWQAAPRSRLTAWPKRALGSLALRMLARESLPALRFEHVLFPSRFMRDDLARRGVKARRSRVVYGAVDTTPYVSPGAPERRAGDGWTLLYVGRLAPSKGVHVAVEAMAQLVHRLEIRGARLLIVGAGEARYEARLRALVRRERLEPFVEFVGRQGNRAMPEYYRRADVLLFTSLWPESFGRVLVEAMASGAVAVGAAVGGAAEILEHGQNALVSRPGDARDLAAQVARLIRDPDLWRRLSQAGRRVAVSRFDIKRMVDEIEEYLSGVAA